MAANLSHAALFVERCPFMEHHTIEARWCKLPLQVLFDGRLSKADLQIYGMIAHKAGTRGWFWGKQQDLAEVSHVARETMARSVTKLREYGYIRTWQRERSGLLCYAIAALTQTFVPNLEDDPIDDLSADAALFPPPPKGENPERDALVEEATHLFGPARTKDEAKQRKPYIDQLLESKTTPQELRIATERAAARWTFKPTLKSVVGKIGELLPHDDVLTQGNDEAKEAKAQQRKASLITRGIYTPGHIPNHRCPKCLENKRKWEQSVAEMQPQPPERVNA